MKVGLRGSMHKGAFDFIISDIFKGAVDPAVLLPGFCFLSHQRQQSLWTGWCIWQNDSSHGMKHQNQFALQYWTLVFFSLSACDVYIFHRQCGVNTKVRLTYWFVESIK